MPPLNSATYGRGCTRVARLLLVGRGHPSKSSCPQALAGHEETGRSARSSGETYSTTKCT